MAILSRTTSNGRAASPGTMKIGKTVGGLFATNDFRHFRRAKVGDCSLAEVEFFDLFFHFQFVLKIRINYS